MDGVNSAVVLYGLARVAAAVPHFLTGLHAEYQRLKAARAMFSSEERAALEAIWGRTQQLARDVEGLSETRRRAG